MLPPSVICKNTLSLGIFHCYRNGTGGGLVCQSGEATVVHRHKPYLEITTLYKTEVHQDHAYYDSPIHRTDSSSVAHIGDIQSIKHLFDYELVV